MKQFRNFLVVAALLAISINANAGTLEEDYSNPPQSAHAYVWWHWMSSNVSEAGIDKDLAAMKQMGVAGATICDVGSTTGIGHSTLGNSPWPDVAYLSPKWWALVKHSAEVADKLGLDLGMHNCGGWSASGGPWITPELSMQKLVWSETPISGSKQYSGALPVPEVDKKYNFYRDVVVLAVPDGDVGVKDVQDITAQMTKEGTLTWAVPAGKWTIYRFGHTTTSATPHPMPDGWTGLECDKLSADAAKVHIQHVLSGVDENIAAFKGKSFGHILFDSYEAKLQNWTGDFRQQFINLRGYDPIPWLPVIAGRKIGGDALSARFNWDMNKTISDLFVRNNFGVFHDSLKRAGLKMMFEPYKGPFDTISASAECDVPMGEFWNNKITGIAKNVSASAQALGGPIVGAEAFTGNPGDSEFNETPGSLKTCADGAIISGVNQFYLHEWTMQPFGDDIKPGMTAGWWGTHFGRNQTWFEPGKVWFDYLARCSAVLQHGRVVSDYATLEFTEEGNGDALSYALFLTSKAEGGQIALPDGRKYALLVLPPVSKVNPEMTQTMLPEVARKIKELVDGGAAVLGPKPVEAPGLTDYPKCDAEIASIANDLWGDAASASGEHDFGKGKVFWGQATQDVLKKIGLGEDFKVLGKSEEGENIKAIHRRDGNTDIYFVANLANKRPGEYLSFRVTGKIPEIWSTTSPEHAEAAMWKEQPDVGATFVPIPLGVGESVFVIFRQPSSKADPVVAESAPVPANPTMISGSQLPHWGQFPEHKFIKTASGELHFLGSTAGMEGGGPMEIYFASKRTAIINVPGTPNSVGIPGAWQVAFAKGWGAPDSVTMDSLKSWTDSPDAGIKYFSGTATYSKDFDSSQALISKYRVMLNLGDVQSLAQVIVNGKDLGVLWHAPFEVDVTDALQVGTNHLQIKVTNTWHNRLIGDEQQPPDFEWGPVQLQHNRTPFGRPLAAFPDWLAQGKARPSQGRYTFSTWNYFEPTSKLDPAGLIGPVSLRAIADVVVPSH